MELVESCILCGGNKIGAVDERRNLYRCSDCGLVFDNPRPISDDIERYYSEDYGYDNWLKQNLERDLLWKKRLTMTLKEKPSGRLLDIGAGIGQFLDIAKRYYEVTGTEVAERAIVIAREEYEIELIQGPIESLDFKDRFDIITAFHVLEHVPYPGQFIARCAELLAHDGVLIIAVPNEMLSIKSGVFRLLALFRIGKWRDYGIRFALPKIDIDCPAREIHISHFTAATLKSYLERKGFRIKCFTLDPSSVDTGLKRIIQSMLKIVCLAILKLFRINIYDTIWIAASKD